MPISCPATSNWPPTLAPSSRYGEPARTEFPIEILHDGDRLPIGDVRLEILATPGHTPESISIVVYEHGDDVIPYGVLTGDTLFVGDVGRPDLVSGGGSVDVMARDLYRSVKDKLLSLPDATRVFPAHGAGSSCGKNLSTETQSTIGAQRSDNYALAPMGEDAFVALVSDGQPVTPLYFPTTPDAITNCGRCSKSANRRPGSSSPRYGRCTNQGRSCSTLAPRSTTPSCTYAAHSTSGSRGASPSSPAT